MGNRSNVLLIIGMLLITVIFSSCEPFVTYEFIIRNDSNESLEIILFNPEFIYNPNSDKYEYSGCHGFDNIAINGKNIVWGKEESFEVRLNPNDELKFTEYANITRHLEDFHAPWNYQSCIQEIYREGVKLDSSTWCEMSNWQKVEEKSESVRYVLFIR